MDFFGKGVPLLNQAIAFDHAAQFERALALYIRSFEFFLAGLKYSNNEKVKEIVRAKVREFMERAENLKAYLESEKSKIKPQQQDKPLQATDRHIDSAPSSSRVPDDSMRRALESTLLVNKPNLSWKDVAGLDNAKQALEEAIFMPQKFPQMFTGKRKAWKGILLYGPPGTGKSHIARVVASISNATFFSVSSADLVSKYQGDSEKLVKELFAMAADNKPAIVFIDEIDSICGTRGESGSEESINRMKNEFLIRMQELDNTDGVLVMGATNRPFDLDTAVRRRFEKRIYVPLPETPDRQRLFEIHMGEEPTRLDERDITVMAQATEGFSGSDIANVCRDALMQPVRECMQATHWKRIRGADGREGLTPCSSADEDAVRLNMMDLSSDQLVVPDVSREHFERVLQGAKPSVSKDELGMFEKFTRMFGTGEKSADRAKEEDADGGEGRGDYFEEGEDESESRPGRDKGKEKEEGEEEPTRKRAKKNRKPASTRTKVLDLTGN